MSGSDGCVGRLIVVDAMGSFGVGLLVDASVVFLTVLCDVTFWGTVNAAAG